MSAISDTSNLLAGIERTEYGVFCASCCSNLSKDGYAQWRLTLAADRVPQRYPDQAVGSPLDGGPYYFCDLDCLDSWRRCGGA